MNMGSIDDFQHVWVAKGSLETIILFHGTGGDEHSLVRFAEVLAPNRSVLSMRGKVSENGANRFFRRFAEGVLDVEDVAFRANEIAEWLLVASETYGFELGNSVFFGYSNGANIGAALWALRPEAIGHGVFARTMLPIEPKTNLNLRSKRGLILVGENDTITPPNHAEALLVAMASLGATVDCSRMPSGHELTQFDFERASDWIAALPTAE